MVVKPAPPVPVKSEHGALLRAPPERVWAVLADWRRYPEWMPDVAWVRPIGSHREPALRLLVRTRVFGIPAANDIMQVTGWEPPHRLAVRHEGMVRGPAEWLLEPVPEGTRWIWREDLTMPPGLVGELALRAYWPWQRAMFRRSIRNVRRIVEAG